MTPTGTPILIPKNSIGFADLQRQGGVEAALRNIQDATSQPLLQATISPGPKTASGGGQKRRFTIQVVTHGLKVCRGQYALLVVFSTDLTGIPSGVQTVTWITGPLIQAITANKAYLVYTNNQGLAEVDVEVLGGTSRFVRASVIGAAHGTDGVDFT